MVFQWYWCYHCWCWFVMSICCYFAVTFVIYNYIYLVFTPTCCYSYYSVFTWPVMTFIWHLPDLVVVFYIVDDNLHDLLFDDVVITLTYVVIRSRYLMLLHYDTWYLLVVVFDSLLISIWLHLGLIQTLHLLDCCCCCSYDLRYTATFPICCWLHLRYLIDDYSFWCCDLVLVLPVLIVVVLEGVGLFICDWWLTHSATLC